MSNELLGHLSESDIRIELRGFAESTIQTVISLKRSVTPSLLQQAVAEILAFYLPRGTQINLSAQPPSTRLREDLGVDSLTFAEAAFKMEELFGVRIENAALAEIKTLGDLQTFARDLLLKVS